MALCGAGMISSAHAIAAATAGFPIVAVASRHRENAETRARELGAIACEYAELPAGADVVVVATPPSRHHDDTVRLLRAGAAVVLEKPLTRTLAEADSVVATAQMFAMRVGYAENLAYAPVVRAMLDIVDTIGPLTHIEVRTITPLPAWGNFTTDEWGGGVLFDLGAHPLAVALLLARPATVTSVSAKLTGSPTGAHGTDEHAEVTLAFDTGLRATVVASWQGGPLPIWDAQAAGPDGVVRAEIMPETSLERNGEPVALPPVTCELPEIERFGYLDQLTSFADDFAAARRPFMDVEFGRLVLDVTCAAYASAANGGSPQAVPFTGRRDLTPLEIWRSKPEANG